ncbi:MAG TPA: outer membrane lipid asymmetry maintenance protein MlaD [Alphaproteobacteria bacterium]|nr:outer membrane lipid asymmetry maintenance protein MlaD [Alphaproteobacteria bacterium]
MIGRNLVETIMGAFVLLVAGIFLVFAYLSANLQPPGGYSVTAVFSSVDGLSQGADVRVGGVKVGIVTRQAVDPRHYNAVVTMDIERDVKLPVDTKAVIASAGLLGGKYVKIEPGHSQTLLAPGGEITNTEGAVVLEELLGKIIFLATDQDADQDSRRGSSERQSPKVPPNGDATPPEQ